MFVIYSLEKLDIIYLNSELSEVFLFIHQNFKDFREYSGSYIYSKSGRVIPNWMRDCYYDDLEIEIENLERRYGFDCHVKVLNLFEASKWRYMEDDEFYSYVICEVTENDDIDYDMDSALKSFENYFDYFVKDNLSEYGNSFPVDTKKWYLGVNFEFKK